MKNSRRIFIILVALLAIVRVDAQLMLTEYNTYKIEGENILLRWEPRSGEEWVTSKNVGYTIEKYQISSEGIEMFIGRDLIQPSPESDWQRYENSVDDAKYDFVVGAKTFIHPDNDGSENELHNMFDLKGDVAKGNKISLGFLLYTASFDFEIAKLAGLGYEMKREKGYSYRFEIKTGTSDPIIVSVDPATYRESSVPKINPEWGNLEVKLKWDGSTHQEDFLGYIISKSEDGISYKRLNESPKTNNLGLLPDSSALLKMTYTDTLSENNKTYWYKIEGFDYFGNVSTNMQIVSGQGNKPIGISPIIEYANQTDDNQAHLKWYMPEEMDELINRYRITRSDNDNGPFEIVVDSLEKTVKEIKFPMQNIENHFRVEAVPHIGRPVGSFSVFIMGQDTVPPAVPEVIGAIIDSVGNIEIKWKANKEQDLWGYRIFKSNFNEQEYGLINNVISKDTIFRDTVDINFNTENVFYKIYATDTRDNKSAFTLPIKVEKPDIFPPGMAGFGKIEQRNDSLIINWIPSASEDVVNHSIFRRAINVENSWTLVGILDSAMYGKPFIETGLEYNITYAYTIIAYDKVGLKSEAAHPRNFTLKNQKEAFVPITSVSYDFNEELKAVTLTWDLKERSRVEHILIYRGTDKNKLGKYKMLSGDDQNLVDLATNESTLYYKIKPIYDGQTEDYYSETIEVKISKSE